MHTYTNPTTRLVPANATPTQALTLHLQAAHAWLQAATRQASPAARAFGARLAYTRLRAALGAANALPCPAAKAQARAAVLRALAHTLRAAKAA